MRMFFCHMVATWRTRILPALVKVLKRVIRLMRKEDLIEVETVTTLGVTLARSRKRMMPPQLGLECLLRGPEVSPPSVNRRSVRIHQRRNRATKSKVKPSSNLAKHVVPDRTTAGSPRCCDGRHMPSTTCRDEHVGWSHESCPSPPWHRIAIRGSETRRSSR